MVEQVVHLEVGEPKIRLFEKKRPIAAVAELVWNGLDANATQVDVTIERSLTDAIDRIIVSDNGDGITPEQAQDSFREYGDTWKSTHAHTLRKGRILHGRNGEGRLYALALGDTFTWDSVAMADGELLRTRISTTRSHPTIWTITGPETATAGLPTLRMNS
jgi:hypothetical protein